MTTATRLAIVAAVVFLLGAVAATVLPTSPEGVTCGTWVTPEWSDEAMGEVDAAARSLAGKGSSEGYLIADRARQSKAACDGALGTRRNVALVLLGLGLVVPVGLMFVGAGTTRKPAF